MDSDEETIFNEAITRADPLERSKYLENACGGDSHLRWRVVSLLDAYSVSDFLEQIPPEIDAYLSTSSEGGLEGMQVGPYCVLELIGEGGMGDVYLAERFDDSVVTQVALKVIRLGMDSHQVIARFNLEQQALKRLEHPHIAKLIESGVTETGRAYFAMELVQGIPITQFCDREQLPLGQRVALLVQACRAIQHAHERGLVHRDLKPSNVLVSMQAGQPVVKVIDFGGVNLSV